MRKIFLTIPFLLLALSSFSQPGTPYDIQRRKLNSMLDARTAKFGQYENSLGKKTGIFGLKTKKDMQRSIDILIDIMQTDNAILRETKALLQYKDFEKTEVQTKADDSQQRISAYMRTIKLVQDQNEKLNTQIGQLQKQNSRFTLAFVALITMVLVLFVWARKKSR